MLFKKKKHFDYFHTMQNKSNNVFDKTANVK